jgi:methyl-accepting chemotaxis protein WspA
MKDWTIRRKILASFGVILLALIAVGAVAHLQLAGIHEEAASVRADSVPGIYYSAELKAESWESFAYNLEYAAHSDPAGKKEVEEEIQANKTNIGETIALYEATIFAAEDRQLFETFKEKWAAYLRAQQEFLNSITPLSDDAQIEAGHERLHPLFMASLAAIDAVLERNHNAAFAAAQQVSAHVDTLRIGMLAGFVAAVVLALFSGYYLIAAITRPLDRLGAAMNVMRQGDFTQRLVVDRRDEFGDLADGFNRMADEVMLLVGNVQRSGIQVSTSMTEIAATSKQQQATASEIAATTSEIGATSKEISATSKDLVKTMNAVATVAEGTASLAINGQAGLSQMEETMGQVMEAAGSINAKLAVLNEKAGNINQVVTTIAKVADQTNLLSLNAAIEAEKAGEYGRGFAAVAAEIRRLADQTAVATYDIEQMVKEIQSAVSAGVMGMDKFSEQVRRGMHDVQEVGGQLSQIIQQVQALVPRIETVNEGMQAQATGAGQISEALLQLTEAARQTVESLSQSTSAIDELNQISGNLRSGVSRFKLEAAA